MEATQPEVSVVIPARNEAAGIGAVLDGVREALEGRCRWEAIVVDTASADGTPEIARAKGATVISEPRRGYGRAYRTGFRAARSELIATLDADGSYPAEELPRLIALVTQSGYEFVTTDRFAGMEAAAMGPIHRLGNRILTVAARLLFGIHSHDSQSGMWVFRREILGRLRLTQDGMPFSEEIKIEAFKKCRFVEVPIPYRARIGDVKLHTWRDGLRNLIFLLGKRFGLARAKTAD